MLTIQDYIKKLKAIEFHTNMKTRNEIAGTYHSAFKGQGMSFSECRAFADGDDVRYIDWNASARQNSLFVKQFIEERELSVCIILDLSPSMSFGSISISKAEAAIEAMSIVSFSALKNNDQVSLMMFDSFGYKVIPFTKGHHKTLHFILEAMHFRGTGEPCLLADSLNKAAKILKRKSLVFVISDFQASEYEIPIKLLSHKHEVIPVVVSDPLETSMVDLGLCFFEDTETHEANWCDTSLPETRVRMKLHYLDQIRCQNVIFKHTGLRAIRIDTTSAILLPLTRAFDTRANHV